MAETDLELSRLRVSLNAKLSNAARSRGVAADLVRKQYVFTLFLGRLFGGSEPTPWVLLGGNALMIRTGGGRFTQDIDLARDEEWDDTESVREELQSLLNGSAHRDPFTFDIVSIESHSEADPFGYGASTAKAKVRAYLGMQLFDQFSIDITSRRHIDGPVDHIPLRAMIDHETLNDLPSVPTTPAENHLADKICAMYELHGEDGKPSTRYRDLADAVRLVRAAGLDANRLLTVLRREEGRRKMTLPLSLVSPADAWQTQYPKAARGFAGHPEELITLSASLNAAGECLNEILAGDRTAGTWDAERQEWQE